MDERRAQLLRQRAAIAQHLAWLDAEIAATGAPSPPASLPAVPPSPVDAAQPWPADFTPPSSPEFSKRGCWLSFALLMTLLLGGAVAAIYHLYG